MSTVTIKGHGEPLDTINPATEEALATVSTANESDVDKAVAAAREAFETTWGTNCAGTERGRLMFKYAEAIEKSTDDLAMIEALDTGKPIAWCKADISDSVACIRFFAGAADKICGATIEIDDQEKYASTRKEPMGVVAQIVPWNYPIMMWAWKVAPALATGCAIVFKPAENTPLSTLKLAEIFGTIEFPKGSFNVLNGLGKTTGQALADHMDIDKIAFTGSTVVGKQIAISAATSNLKRCTLELGGKSPNIVFESARLAEAAKWAAFGIFENNGQSCTAGSRILVQETVYEEFLKHLVEAANACQKGDPMNEDSFTTSLISKAQFDKVMGYIEQGKANGAKVAAGGKRFGDKGFFVEPTVFTDVKEDNLIYKEEIFGMRYSGKTKVKLILHKGPVASVVKFKDEADAIRMANDTVYGLAAGIHTMDWRQMHRVTRKIKAGTVWQNQYVAADCRIPFGGYRQSGWGRELSLQGMDSYLETKAVHHYYGIDLDWPIKL